MAWLRRHCWPRRSSASWRPRPGHRPTGLQWAAMRRLSDEVSLRRYPVPRRLPRELFQWEKSGLAVQDNVATSNRQGLVRLLDLDTDTPEPSRVAGVSDQRPQRRRHDRTRAILTSMAPVRNARAVPRRARGIVVCAPRPGRPYPSPTRRAGYSGTTAICTLSLHDAPPTG